jgi:hypothetical protein
LCNFTDSCASRLDIGDFSHLLWRQLFGVFRLGSGRLLFGMIDRRLNLELYGICRISAGFARSDFGLR